MQEVRPQAGQDGAQRSSSLLQDCEAGKMGTLTMWEGSLCRDSVSLQEEGAHRDAAQTRA